MKSSTALKRTVLLTGGGGPAIPGMIDTLKRLGFRVVVVDMMDFAAGYFFSDASYVVPAGSASNFFESIKNICFLENVDAIVSVVDEELLCMSNFEDIGITVVQPQKRFIRLALDKYHCMKTLQENGIRVPETWLLKDIPQDVDFPIFIKPRVGRGSRGCFQAQSFKELKDQCERSSYSSDELLAQRCIIGTEYTVSVVVWRDGVVKAVVPKEIISKVGVTRAAVTRKNIRIDEICRAIQSKLKANGPFNVQLIIDESGAPWVFEINPRFSTSTTLTAAAGVNELGNLLSLALFENTEPCWEWKAGVVLLRKSTDIFMSERDFTSVSIHKEY